MVEWRGVAPSGVAAWSLSCACLLAVAGCGTPDPMMMTEPRCGDGMIDEGETCDDGDAESADGCNAFCRVESGWECDGESPTTCTMARCGDGRVQTGEACDPGMMTATCDDDCTAPECGDDELNTLAGEQCDDGNTMSGDGCSPTCMDEPDACGDGTCDGEGGENCETCAADCMSSIECSCTDADDDGYFDIACGGNDCNDSDGAIHPDAEEIACNDVNDDCDLTTADSVDSDMDGSNCYLDCDDMDAMRSPRLDEVCGDMIDNDCNDMTIDTGDADADGAACDVDCDDTDPLRYPGNPELCNNGRDDDCDRMTRDVFDNDMDTSFCNADCNDMSALARPGLTEICGDMLDNDCNATTLDLFDRDGDGVSCADDCDDNGRAVPEVCNNGMDDDCDPRTLDLFDADGDGSSCAVDCDDANPRRATTIREICGNLLDDDCDAMTADSGDSDGDGVACDIDCNDADPLIVPDASGRCGPRFVYDAHFETGAEGWTTTGTTSWACGTIGAGKDFIRAAAVGTGACATSLTGDYMNNEEGYLVSPSFDMSGIYTDPRMRFSHIFQTESCCDEGRLEMSVDGGVTWRPVGATGQGTNWYGADGYWRGNSGTAGAWRTAAIVLTGAAGQPDEVRAKVEEYKRRGCTCPVLYPMSDPYLMIDTFSY